MAGNDKTEHNEGIPEYDNLETAQEKLRKDPIMREYIRKILGDDAEIPADYGALIMESRRRGRQGLPQPFLRPHRCDKHLQDMLDGLFFAEFMPPARVYFKCMRSKPGEEPERYVMKKEPKKE
ncbi:hypothetical protein GGI07_002110 [Coemansia sp. Benny D115]|nr:hypothetical protein GGI07_002110 [Coemansia sp. Benny D115]